MRNRVDYSAVAGTSIQLGDIHFYLDPTMIDRMKTPLSGLSSAYSDTLQPTATSSKDRSSRVSNAAELHLRIRSVSARIYSPHRLHASDSDQRVRSRIGFDVGGVHWGRSQGHLIQAQVDWLKADLSQLTGM